MLSEFVIVEVVENSFFVRLVSVSSHVLGVSFPCQVSLFYPMSGIFPLIFPVSSGTLAIFG